MQECVDADTMIIESTGTKTGAGGKESDKERASLGPRRKVIEC